jgi:hypothetical protein
MCIPAFSVQLKRFTTLHCSKSITARCNGLHKTLYFLCRRSIQLSDGSMGSHSWIQQMQVACRSSGYALSEGLVFLHDEPDATKVSVNEYRHT